MTTKIYTLTDFNDIIFNGFNYVLPHEILKNISELSLEVGSPTYVKTPVFQKKDNQMKLDPKINVNDPPLSGFKKKRGKNMEVISDNDWDSLRTFQTTKIEERVGLDAQIDIIRSYLNKLSEKNYVDIKTKIIDNIDEMVRENTTNEDMICLCSTIFEIASTNRFYSNMYADLYCELIHKYEIMKVAFEDSLNKFIELFNHIEYVESSVDYDKFCKINKDNEKRKALGSFFINLMINGIISKDKIIYITWILLSQIYKFISEENKKNEVDELTENIAILYVKDLYQYDDGDKYKKIEGFTISEIIEKLANSKVKDYKSITNKTIFKFMDMIDM